MAYVLDSKIIAEASLVRLVYTQLLGFDYIKKFGKAPKLKLIFRGSFHGFKGKNFHSCCDNKGPTLTLVKTEKGEIFGAFTDIPWQSHGEYKNGNCNTFIFSLKDSFSFQKFKCLKQ